MQHPRPSPPEDRRRHPRQLDKVAHVTNLGGSNPTTILLAKRLVDIAPPGLKHVFFSDDGATAVEVAIKMALQYWRQVSGKGTVPFVEAPSGPFRQMGPVPFSSPRPEKPATSPSARPITATRSAA